MSKKSRKRNKRLLMLAALAGGAAMMGRGKGTAFPRPKAGTIDQMAADAAGPVTGVTNPNEAKAAAADAVTTGTSPYLSRMGGAGDLAAQLASQRKRANFAQRGRMINPHEATAAAGAAYNPHQVIRGRINRSKGGSVTGIAKRGFGRALMKGKK